MTLSKVFADALPDLIVAAVTGVVAVLAGSWLVLYWNTRQKQRELDLSTAQTFHRLYGEFFAVWKLWNCFIKDIGACAICLGPLDGSCSSGHPDAEEGGIRVSWAPSLSAASWRPMSSMTWEILLPGPFESLRETTKIRDQTLELERVRKPSTHRSFKELATSVAADHPLRRDRVAIRPKAGRRPAPNRLQRMGMPQLADPTEGP